MDKNKEKRAYRQIDITGLVQGVGFRPAVVNLARKLNVTGEVWNDGNGCVGIRAAAADGDMQKFIKELQDINLPNCLVEDTQIVDILEFEAEDFRVKLPDCGKLVDEMSAKKHRNDNVFLPKDVAICDKCLAELRDPKNRRYNHPFISCSSCGARFSILQAMPYDRENTSMAEFCMCGECEDEYNSPDDRRFWAQTLACNNCGPVLKYYDDGKTANYDNAIDAALQSLENGEIIAIKGIGGYHFACLPSSECALRELKNRDTKPFAVMFPNLDEIKKVCRVSEAEETLLTSNERPIVILDKISENDTCGCFLPYTPLQYLLLDKMGSLIMTSANKASAPIIKDDDEMLDFAAEHKIGVLTYKRDILRRLDDSVMCAVGGDKPQTIRIGRGIAPLSIKIHEIPCQARNGERKIFAAGSDLKNSFCIAFGEQAIISQHVGDLEECETFANYQNLINDYFTLYNFAPDLIMCDAHPKYFSSEFAKNMGLPVIEVQHHHAHIASVMAEHSISSPVIGVCFDGIGYGTDGNVWGGEFLICEGAKFERIAHLPYVKMIGGDSSMKDADKTAYCYGVNGNYRDAQIVDKALENDINIVWSSSMGRLFDTMASVLDIAHYNSYEGECAIKLEQAARKVLSQLEPPRHATRATPPKEGNGGAAYAFHEVIAEMIAETCEKARSERGINTVCLSGGVLQNKLLCKLAIEGLIKKGFEVFMNEKVPPNDGGIALGQAYIGQLITNK